MTRKAQYIKLRFGKKPLTLQQIADRFGVTRQAVYGSISYKSMSNKQGDFKYGVRIGLGGRDYWKEVARIRDNHTCQSCGKRWKEGQRKLNVSHIKEKNTRRYYCKSDLKDLVTRCHKCIYSRL